MAGSLRPARRALGHVAERLRRIEERLQTIHAGVPVPEWPQDEDYDDSMARHPAVALAHDVEHVLVAYLRPAIATLDRAAAEKETPRRRSPSPEAATPPDFPLVEQS